ncbi:hypothetical protein FOA52_014866 [Chlamydomonas sp. UWO 241]|nr:hypothetical protein FOA52_014866 [Chlamydomonas sp. UWO 241]
MATTTEAAAAVECETFHKLEAYMGSEAFLAKLAASQSKPDVAKQMNEAMGTPITNGPIASAAYSTFEVEHPPAAASAAAAAAAAAASAAGAHVEVGGEGGSASCSGEDVMAEGFVVIDRPAAIEAMAFYIAECLMRCPQLLLYWAAENLEIFPERL